MNTKSFTQFLEQVEEVAANLDCIPSNLLEQLSYLVLTEIKERKENAELQEFTEGSVGEPDECLEAFNQEK